MHRVTLAAGVAAISVGCAQARESSTASVSANPIRKVVTMLEAMKTKVEQEGEKEAEMYKKYACYCKNSGGTLEKSIGDADTKIPQVSSAIKEAEAEHSQLQEDLTSHRSDRAEAKKAMADATKIREDEAAAFAKYKAEADSNIAALGKAAAAVDNGMAGAFLQSQAASVVRHLVQSQENMLDADRDDVIAFLSASQGSDYAPQSGQIAGILKQLKDEMSQALADATATENNAIKVYEELMAAKTKEVAAQTASIEEKTVRVGEVAVSIAEMKNDLSDTQAALLEDQKFLADLKANCAKREEEWDEVVKTRNEELVALSETIKLLQDDDALELFKKTLPSASSFVQVSARTGSDSRSQALSLIQAAQKAAIKSSKPQLDFISLALRGNKMGFSKVISMIDDMVAALKKEQTDDDDKKEYCAVSFDAADDKKKGLERGISDSEAAIDDAKESISTLNEAIKALKAGISDLDKSVAEATENRKEENSEFTEMMSQNTAAKELINIAKNRMNKFYNPKLYKPAPKRELSEQDRIVVNMGGTLAPTPAPGGIAGTGVTVLAQVSVHNQGEVAPPPPPEAVGAYKKKSEDSNGVIAMMDLLIKDLDKQMTEGETMESDAQADYQVFMKDSADKRAEDSKTLGDKEAALADTEAALQAHSDDKTSLEKEHAATMQYIASLHAECDWLLQYFDVRKEARASEIDALGKAKAVLSGADYSLLQTRARSLRGVA